VAQPDQMVGVDPNKDSGTSPPGGITIATATPCELHTNCLVLNKEATDPQSLYRILTEDKNRETVESIVAEYFDGFTLSSGIGYWKGNRHASVTIEVIPDSISDETTEAHLQEIAQRIRELNEQKCVLIQKLPVLWSNFMWEK
jgi:hypothetical protein